MTGETAFYDQGASPGAAPVFILPDRSRIFLERSNRFTALAEGHSLADWLTFLGRLTRTQHELLQEYPILPLPDEAALNSDGEHPQPPLAAPFWPRDPSWRQALFALARDLLPYAPAPAQDTLKNLQEMGGPVLEAMAERVLRMELEGLQPDYLPFIAAALQVYWTALAAGLDRTKIRPFERQDVCPCCGFLPVAGIVRLDGEVSRLRYLHCGLCNTEWHLERVTCAGCRDSNGITYRFIEGSDRVVCAETCEACNGYLKNVYQGRSPQADPVADDLATLALDLLVDQAGYNRLSPNLFLTPGRETSVQRGD